MAGKDAGGALPHVGVRDTGVRFLAAVAVLITGWSAAAGWGHAQTSAPAPAATQAAAANSLLAVVNGEQIGREQLSGECLRRYGTDVLDSMVHKQIILQGCNARGIAITAQEIEEEIQRIASRFGLDIERWLSLLENERNVDANQYRKDIVWPTLALRRIAAQDIEVTQQDYQQAFESEYGETVKARLIAVTSRAKADWLLEQARAKPDQFGQLAKEHSEDRATASAYGVIPPIRKHVGDPTVEQAAFALAEGAISPILQIGNQYVILRCEKQIPRTYISPEQMKAVEERLKDQIRESKLRVQAATVFQQLQTQFSVVTVYGDRDQQASHPGVAALVNQQPVTMQQLADECLARYGEDVLEGEINRTLLLQELRRRGSSVGDQDINLEVARAADAYGYVKADGSPDIDAWLKAVTEDDATTIELYVRDAVWPSVALKKLVGDQVEVTDEDLQKGFESNYGERVEVLAIMLGNLRQAQTVWEMARNNPTDQFFGELASQYSIEPSSRANFGKVPPLRLHSGQPLLEKEAFKLKAGELSGIIALGDKYLILRCLGRTEPIVQDFADVREELLKDIREKKLRLAMAQEFARLKESAQIDNFLARTSQPGKPLAAPVATQASFNAPAAGQPAKR